MTVPNSAVPQPAPGAAGAPQATPAPSAPAAAAPAAPAQPVANPQGTPAPASGGMVPIAALHEERTKRQELAAQLDQLQQTVRQLQNPANPQQVAPQAQEPQQQGMSLEQIEQLWVDDPKQAVRAEIMTAFNWYDQMGIGLEMAADALAQKAQDFSLVRGQVMNYVRTLPLNQRTPQVIERAYYMMRGQNVDNIIKQREAEWQQRMGAPAQFQVPSTGTYGAGPVAPGGGVALSAEQVAAAQMMGLTPEAYAQNLKVPTAPGVAR